jgi:hypothetical protein
MYRSVACPNFLATFFKNAYNRQKKRLPKQTPKSKALDFTGA